MKPGERRLHRPTPVTYCLTLFSFLCLSESAVFSQSDLCFLSHGGSSETFTINEGVPVGSIIGVLKVSCSSACIKCLHVARPLPITAVVHL